VFLRWEVVSLPRPPAIPSPAKEPSLEAKGKKGLWRSDVERASPGPQPFTFGGPIKKRPPQTQKTNRRPICEEMHGVVLVTDRRHPTAGEIEMGDQVRGRRIVRRFCETARIEHQLGPQSAPHALLAAASASECPSLCKAAPSSASGGRGGGRRHSPGNGLLRVASRRSEPAGPNCTERKGRGPKDGQEQTSGDVSNSFSGCPCPSPGPLAPLAALQPSASAANARPPLPGQSNTPRQSAGVDELAQARLDRQAIQQTGRLRQTASRQHVSIGRRVSGGGAEPQANEPHFLA